MGICGSTFVKTTVPTEGQFPAHVENAIFAAATEVRKSDTPFTVVSKRGDLVENTCWQMPEGHAAEKVVVMAGGLEEVTYMINPTDFLFVGSMDNAWKVAKKGGAPKGYNMGVDAAGKPAYVALADPRMGTRVTEELFNLMRTTRWGFKKENATVSFPSPKSWGPSSRVPVVVGDVVISEINMETDAKTKVVTERVSVYRVAEVEYAKLYAPGCL